MPFPIYNLTPRKICQNTGFLWRIFSRIWTESKNLFFYGKIQVRENPKKLSNLRNLVHPIIFAMPKNPRARKSDFHLYMFFKKLFETFSLIQASHIFNFQTWKRNDLADWVLNTEKGSTIFSNPNNIDK